MHDTLTSEIANGASSNNRAETNRENAKSSTGPRTEAAYQRHCKGFHDQYQPKNPTEVQLTQTVADLSWRLNRSNALETNMLTLGITEKSNSVDTENDQVHTSLAMAKAFREQSQAFANLTLYEHRLNVRFDKALKQLREMQEQRHRQELWVMPEAARLLKMHKAKGVPYNPVDDGFVFSERDIETYIQRENRKNQAYAAAS